MKDSRVLGQDHGDGGSGWGGGGEKVNEKNTEGDHEGIHQVEALSLSTDEALSKAACMGLSFTSGSPCGDPLEVGLINLTLHGNAKHFSLECGQSMAIASAARADLLPSGIQSALLKTPGQTSGCDEC